MSKLLNNLLGMYKQAQVAKKAEENDGYITVWLWPGAGYFLNGFATQASSESEALDNVAQYLGDNNMGKYYETEEEHFNRIKEDNPDLSDEELFEMEHNDPTSIYVDNSMGFIGWINSENMKFTNGIDEKHIDQITVIDGPRKNASKKIKLTKKADEDLNQEYKLLENGLPTFKFNTKIIDFLDNINKKFDKFCVKIYGKIVCFNEIKDKKLITDKGEEFDYRDFGPGLLLKIYNKINNKQSSNSKAKAVRKQAEEKLYVAKLYDNKGLKNDNLGKSKSVEELKDLLRDFLFEKMKNRESKPQNNSFYLRDKIVIEDYGTGEPIQTIKVSDLLSTYGKDYWKPFMNTEATKKQATIKHENGVYNVYSESGKCLGKGYKTKEEAEKRLKQVEYFKHKDANTTKMAKANLNALIPLFDEMWYGKGKDKDCIYKGNWNICLGGYDRGYEVNYKGNPVFSITNNNIFSKQNNEDTIKELTGYSYDEIFDFLKKNYKDFSSLKKESNKRTSLRQVVISKMAENKK